MFRVDHFSVGWYQVCFQIWFLWNLVLAFIVFEFDWFLIKDNCEWVVLLTASLFYLFLCWSSLCHSSTSPSITVDCRADILLLPMWLCALSGYSYTCVYLHLSFFFFLWLFFKTERSSDRYHLLLRVKSKLACLPLNDTTWSKFLG